MTEEQIQQNAEEYAKEHYDIPFEDDSSMNVIVSEESYIEGAHSRDDEVGILEGFLKIKAHEIKQLKAELNKAKNPWRDGNEKPQDIYCDYLLDYGEHYRAAMYDSGMWMSYDLHPLKQPIRWMPIPEGGEE